MSDWEDLCESLGIGVNDHEAFDNIVTDWGHEATDEQYTNDQYQTLEGWGERGRGVRKGEKSKYLKSQRKSVFHMSQTYKSKKHAGSKQDKDTNHTNILGVNSGLKEHQMDEREAITIFKKYLERIKMEKYFDEKFSPTSLNELIALETVLKNLKSHNEALRIF